MTNPSVAAAAAASSTGAERYETATSLFSPLALCLSVSVSVYLASLTPPGGRGDTTSPCSGGRWEADIRSSSSSGRRSSFFPAPPSIRRAEPYLAHSRSPSSCSTGRRRKKRWRRCWLGVRVRACVRACVCGRWVVEWVGAADPSQSHGKHRPRFSTIFLTISEGGRCSDCVRVRVCVCGAVPGAKASKKTEVGLYFKKAPFKIHLCLCTLQRAAWKNYIIHWIDLNVMKWEPPSYFRRGAQWRI